MAMELVPAPCGALGPLDPVVDVERMFLPEERCKCFVPDVFCTSCLLWPDDVFQWKPALDRLGDLSLYGDCLNIKTQEKHALIGVIRAAGMSRLLAASDFLRPWMGNIETGPMNLWENRADSDSVICETDCKIISGLTAEEYLNEQHFMNDDGERRQQRRNSVWANSTTQQKRAGHHGEQEDHSGCCGADVAGEHAISVALKNTDPTTAWLIASAVPHHATGNRDLLSGFAPVQGDLFVKTGDAGAAPMRVVGTGNVVTDAVVLPDVWYVPGLVANVVSVSQLAELDYCVAFFGRGQQCYVRSAEDGVVVGAARAGEDGLFALDFIKVPLGL